MKVEVSTDSRVPGKADRIAEVTEVVEGGLSRFSRRLTHVGVHLSDVNGPKGGVDRRCSLEARAASLKPAAVEATAETEAQAVKQAVEKMSRLLGSTFDRLSEHRGPSASGEPT